MRPRSATGATDENPEGRQPQVCRVWEHGYLNSVSDFDGIFMGKKVPDRIALRPGDQIDNPFVCTLKWYYS